MTSKQNKDKENFLFFLRYMESVASDLEALSPSDNEMVRDLLDKIYKSIENLREKTDDKPND